MIYLLALVSIGLGAVGQLLIKIGSGRLIVYGNPIRTLIALFTIPQIVAGLVLFGISFVIWVFVLKNMPLSIAYPMVSLEYVIIFLLSAAFLQEPVYAQKVAGIALVVAGIILMNAR